VSDRADGASTTLAFIDGMRPPAGLPQGEVIARLADGEIYIDHADPVVLISAELFGFWHDDADSLVVALRCTCESCPDDGHGLAQVADPAHHCPVGDVVTLRAVNRTVVYRITRYEPGVHGYIAEWPD
jgi:hypothetical protein